MKAVNPYLNFNGNCEAAFEFYKSVFGGEFATVMRFKETPAEVMEVPAGEAEKIMHMALPIGQGTMLMGSDVPQSMGQAITGTNFNLSLQPESEEEATRLFNALSADGKVTMPLQKTFWNATFGMCIDKFDIQWMVNYDHGQG